MSTANGPLTPRAATGIPGLDDVLGGGFPRRRIHLLQGSPGAGKTTLSLQFLMEGVRQGESCLYIAMSESREEVASVAASHGWDLGGVAVFDASELDGSEEENTILEPAEVELGERMRAILTEVERVQPNRVVLDSCTELRLLAQTPIRYRRQLLALKRQLVEKDRTVLLLDNPSPESPDVLVQSLAHGVVVLEQLNPEYGAERRRLRVLKMRAASYRGGYHDFAIRTGGLRVFPRLVAAEHRAGATQPERCLTGLEPLDRMLGGGLDRGTSTLVVGPAGAGKSTLATQIVEAAARRGETVAVFAFDEPRATLLARARATGLDLAPYEEAGTVQVTQVDPAEISAGELIHQVRTAVERGARMVLIDSLNGLLQAMPSEGSLVLQVHEMLSFLAEKHVVTLLTMAQHGIIGEMLAPADVTYLADTVVLLRYFEAGGGVRKAISVVKKRLGAHESTIREYLPTATGLRLGAPLTAFRGVLTGVPEFEPGAAGAQLLPVQSP
ncbi:putative circadian clock protein, KaiC [Anaeromyxobacter dehalogenans 2CP-1]|uniref:non-specific serine/threonine protein kinase n=1 Tax=Anaeromyxobacter dehalogenans (strain ATCC BAA-258 / DSM 21875 / 2CP-1) TaxID=455488 RepID=B8JG68_ANAD2|nr:ATPase domain-containing protein [Anaeromyxobacter dehalogenans]ACL66471.1 putative circadian clock protein, KaiC [Anaeromyxobacter dehalogenans 2CP-1]